ncbi:hypothetical protein ECTPHS_09463 [Ectothiorhodospira sp. PHS-1]|uniref:hypothetical protein n=1 Tax=Ectothiorhodospira sp. PHS-1 TaxID=519989 RepID=UPI00024A8708|nr:hypothetical protein [Ectothiorhodospira sp. PHS-1]EHQ52909.1 hypothetical protein ECTPHS_09463 [Ectothiorhodospira sp. PHS-1]
MNTTQPALKPPATGFSTNMFADAIGLKAESIRVRLCRTGSFYGVKPGKLPNGRLIWPADSVERLLAQTKEGE